MIRPSRLVVRLDRLVANAVFLRRLSKNEFFCPMVKANAYGHGAVEVSRALVAVGMKQLGVALYEEGIQLRQAGISDPQILVFGPLSVAALKAISEFKLTPVIVRSEDAHLLAKSGISGLSVHVKVQTGMQRLGVSTDEVKTIFTSLESAGLRVEGLCTHLPNAEDSHAADSTTERSLSLFNEVCEKFPQVKVRHALNSSGLILQHQRSSPWIERFGARPGISLYGVGPASELHEALSVQTQIIQVHEVNAGEGVSYGHIWKATRPSVIGVLPIGYADGVRRGLSGKIFAQTMEKRVPCVGRICMDYIMVDLTDLGLGRDQLLGQDIVVLDGSADGMSATAWANVLDTIPYEVMTGFSSRLPREYV